MQAQPQRTPFTLADLAHVVGGKIVQIHDNWCKALTEDGRCTCGTTDYRIVREGKQR